MMNWLHNSTPPSVWLDLGLWQIHYYGLVMVLAMVAALWLAIKLSKIFKLEHELILDLAFWLIICGLLGARLYHIGLEWTYYSQHWSEMLMIWNGGLAIHGGILGGLVAMIIFAKKRQVNFWYLAGAVAPALLLGQAIGRWGNYFNQELFGRPTDLPWGILIDRAHRPAEYLSFSHFHPTFLYEFVAAIVSLMIVALLLKRWLLMMRANKLTLIEVGQLNVAAYLICFGIYRLAVEMIKIDQTPMIYAWRWPQLVSALAIIIGLYLFATIFINIWHKQTK